MDNFKQSINKILDGAVNSFARFPVSIISAILIALIAIVRITMQFEVQSNYEILFASLQLALLFSAVFSMAMVIYKEVGTKKENKTLLYSSILEIILPIIAFILLYFFGRSTSNQYSIFSTIAFSRMIVATLVSAIAFVYFISKSKIVDNFSDGFFIAHRAFIISAIYGIVLMLGTFGVIGAFQSLVYRGLSSLIYQYVGVIIAFITYTIFLGYFPDFSGSNKTEEMKVVEKQPSFIVVLFGNIIVPIMIALTGVLLIWAVSVLFKGVDVSFSQLSSITTSYVIVGIWIHIMVANHNSKITNFYKKFYPYSAILVLTFEAWALIERVQKVGIQTTEYSFAMLWIFAVVSVALLIILKTKAYRKIAIAAIVVSIVWVMPLVGYQDLTFRSQVNRLKNILIQEDILVDNNITKTNKIIDITTRSNITDTVDFIAYSEKTKSPTWFVEDLNDHVIFKENFGFDKTYGTNQETTDYASQSFVLDNSIIDISEYTLSLTTRNDNTPIKFKENDKDYEIVWKTDSGIIPEFTMKQENTTIIEENLEKYLNELMESNPLDDVEYRELTFKDMSFVIENKDVKVLLIFDSIDLFVDKIQDTVDYSMIFEGLYIKFK